MSSQESESISFGSSLPDALHPLLSISSSHISLATDLSTFLAERANLEREYAGKLQSITKKSREKVERRAVECFAGPEPNSRVEQSEALRQSTLLACVNKYLGASDEHANAAAELAEQLDGVGQDLGGGAKKRAEIVKKHAAFASRLLAERDRVYKDRLSAKAKYDDSCMELESARAKKVSAEAEGKHADRAQRAFQEAEEAMEARKNAYLLSVSNANRAKAAFYRASLPATTDNLQTLWTLSTSRMVDALASASEHSADFHVRLKDVWGEAEGERRSVDVGADQTLYVQLNKQLNGWQEPPDEQFEESKGFYDTAEFRNTEATKVLLQNRLLKARTRLDELYPLIEAKRKESEGLERLRGAYLENSKLGNVDDVMDQLLETARETCFLEFQASVADSEAEEIVQVIGDDSSDARPHNTSVSLGLSRSATTASRASVASASSSTVGGPTAAADRRSVPPTARAVPAPTTAAPHGSGAAAILAAAAQDSEQSGASGKMLYAYDANGDDEVSVSEDEGVIILAGDDGGWSRVQTASGSSGLVPTSYVDQSAAFTAPTAPAPIPARPPPTSRATKPAQTPQVKRVTALYDYAAQGNDEIDLTEGEQVELTGKGLAFGDGWAQGRDANGRVGLFPAGYVRED
ncbi:Cdc42-interacting protein CIP4 [Ceraceosorus bombacis]|uniref:Cdc42-interacting protein CIP4 n=1 Tax=Ceraceosorus bombacis TaxID=401625 RepID=A0A0P1BIF6_9BASI|nr:Cdc42-interacting protein CIP4 [Ceraceosorus bombacis]